MVTVSVNDVVQFRVSAILREHDGYVHNAPQADGDGEDARSARLSVSISATPRFRANFTVQGTMIGGIGPVSLDIPYVYDQTGQVSHAAPPLPSDPRTFTFATPQSLSIHDVATRWQFVYDFPALCRSKARWLNKYDWYVLLMKRESRTGWRQKAAFCLCTSSALS